jgi:hypothetical protein
MKFLIPLLFLPIACVHVPGEITAVGGKGAFKSNNVALIYDNETSFRDGMLAAAALGAGYFSSVAQQAAETTAQITAREAEKTAREAAAQAAAVEITKSDNAVRMAELAVP